MAYIRNMSVFNYNAAAAKWKKNVSSGKINASAQVARNLTPNQKREMARQELMNNFATQKYSPHLGQQNVRPVYGLNQGESTIDPYKGNSMVKRVETPNEVAAREARSNQARNRADKEYAKRMGLKNTGNRPTFMAQRNNALEKKRNKWRSMGLKNNGTLNHSGTQRPLFQGPRSQHGPAHVAARKTRKNRR